jgi:hypothetical protein
MYFLFRWSIEDKLIWTSDALARLDDIRSVNKPAEQPANSDSDKPDSDRAVYGRIWGSHANSSMVAMSVSDFLTAIMSE